MIGVDHVLLALMVDGAACQMPIRRSGAWNGRGLSKTLLIMLKIAVFAPDSQRQGEQRRKSESRG